MIIGSMLVSLGILSNPDSSKRLYGDDYLPCADTGKLEPHIQIDGKMVCKTCGAVYQESKDSNTTIC